MVFPRLNIPWKKIFKVFLSAFILYLIIFLGYAIYRFGFSIGFREGQSNAQDYYAGFFEDLASRSIQTGPAPGIITSDDTTPQPVPTREPSLIQKADWGGPELWEAVNKRRAELGVNPLSQRDELCTIASIRLNELLVLGSLDNHEGFSNMSERRQDLAWIFDKYSTMAEFLAQGGQSAQETVSLWENTLGHKKLLTGGEYVWGCIYAQNTFAVAITAF